MKEAKQILEVRIKELRDATYEKKSIRALVVDDNPLDQRIREVSLIRAGCDKVDVVASGEVARAKIAEMARKKMSYDIVACDYELSEDVNKLNGAQVVVLISAIPQCKNVFVWCVTSKPGEMEDEIRDGLGCNVAFLDQVHFTAKGTMPFLRKQSAPVVETQAIPEESPDTTRAMTARRNTTYPGI